MTSGQLAQRCHALLIIAYQLILALALFVAGPVLLLKKKVRPGLLQKFGAVPREIAERNFKDCIKDCIWIHAVSVGEFNAALPLLRKLKETHPDVPLVVSTTTATGQSLAREKAVGANLADACFYFPFDLSFCFEPWLNAIAPRCFVTIETEIWPAFVSRCRAKNIPVIAINARISPRSFERYSRVGYFFRRVFESFTAIGAQSDSERERFTALGAHPGAISVIGNIKMDGLTPIAPAEIDALREQIGLTPDDFVVVAGSTHESEESLVLDACRALSELAASAGSGKRTVRLIIAPRHPERFERAASIIESRGLSVKRFSKDERFSRDKEAGEVYLLDGLGQLGRYYCLASAAFVGGTFVPVGGHNVAEPYAYSVPVCCGPGLSKTRDIAQSLTDRGALLVCQNGAELEKTLISLYSDEEKRAAIGSLGAAWLKENQGAVDRALRLIDTHLQNRGAAEPRPLAARKSK
ncbi:MAG: 3-deoxy-D-manno-octulosonic acid transferase [Candidatus Melainabacteria bacterium]|nr:3-deoxy-D-manno-octulosonic acid transferase [Candidatus Melainabacteria bacterium]